MSTFETIWPASVSRRTLLKGAGAVGIASALATLPLTASAQSVESLQDILNVTVTVEQFGVTILGAGLASAAAGHYSPPIPAPVIAIVTAARAQEQFHLDFFRGLGGVSLTQTFTIPPALLTDSKMFFLAVAAEEEREIAAQLAAMKSFVAMGRPDLVKASFQYAAEEAEHRVLANYAAGARPANDRAFEPILYNSASDIIVALKQLGIIGGSGTPITFPGPGTIDLTNVIERTPGGPSVSCSAAPMPSGLPNTGGAPLGPILAAGAALALIGAGLYEAAKWRATEDA